jgi:hypothetical protein
MEGNDPCGGPQQVPIAHTAMEQDVRGQGPGRPVGLASSESYAPTATSSILRLARSLRPSPMSVPART